MSCHYEMASSWPFLVRACLSFPSSLHVTPSFLFSSLFSLQSCLPLKVPLSLLLPRPRPGALPPSTLVSSSRWRAGPAPPTRRRVTRLQAASRGGGAARPRRRIAHGRSRASGPPLLYLRLRGSAAEPVGTEETRWRCARCGGSWTGPRPSYPCPPVGRRRGLESRRWQRPGTTSPSLASVSIGRQDGFCLCSLVQPLAPTHLLSQRLGGTGEIYLFFFSLSPYLHSHVSL